MNKRAERAERRRKLLTHHFEPDIEIDRERSRLSDISDKIFENIVASYGKVKLYFIREFNKNNKLVIALLDHNKSYFTLKRKHFMARYFNE